MARTQFVYQPRYKANQLICGQGQTAVITGWTVKQSLAKHLLSQDYAVIGNLYSPTRGISPLLRNLLANPHVRCLVILNATKEDNNAGGCQCLVDFFKQGFTQGMSDTGRDCWVICSATPAYIDGEIAAEALETLRQALQWQEAKSIPEAITIVKACAQIPWQPWGKPLLFPTVETTPKVLPGPIYGHRIEGKTIAETWVKIIHRIKTTGTIRPTQYGQWQELIDLTAIVTDEPPDFYFPQPNYLPIEPKFIDNYISQMLDDAPHQEGVKYTYGQRLRSWFGRDQIEQAIQKLVTELDSSRVVMSLWDVQDYEGNDSPPCLNHIWLRVAPVRGNEQRHGQLTCRPPGSPVASTEGTSATHWTHRATAAPCPHINRELSLTATFRSNDMFSAWCANAMGLRALQQHIYQEIKARIPIDQIALGPLITISQSAHIYSDCWEHAERVLQTHYYKIRQRNYNDPSGSFVITTQENQIIVEHTTPGSGEVVNRYRGKYARKLYQQIATDCPSLDVEHAMYLGTELQKAEMSLFHQYFYQQDQPLLSDKV